MRLILWVIAISTLYPIFTIPSVEAQSGPRFNGSGSCQSASSLGLPLGTVSSAGGDATPAILTMLTVAGTNGFVCIAVDNNASLRISTQLAKPANGAGLRLTGGGRSFGANTSPTLFLDYTGASNGGYSILNLLTGVGATGSFLEVDHLNVVTSNGNTNRFIFTSSAFAIHDNTIVCSNYCVVAGGQNLCCSANTGTANDWFLGSGYFKNNRMAGSIQVGSAANGIDIESNEIGPGSTAAHNLIDLSGPAGPSTSPSAVRGGHITGNVCEFGVSDVCLHLHNAFGVELSGNQGFDGTNAVMIAADNTAQINSFIGNWVDNSGNTMYGASPTYPDATSLVIDLLTPRIVIPNLINVGGALQGSSAAPAVNAASCAGATIGTGSTNLAGTITGLPGTACTVILTFASTTAAHGWSCSVSNQTHPGNTNMFQQSASNTTTVTFTGTSVASDVLAYGPCAAY